MVLAKRPSPTLQGSNYIQILQLVGEVNWRSSSVFLRVDCWEHIGRALVDGLVDSVGTILLIGIHHTVTIHSLNSHSIPVRGSTILAITNVATGTGKLTTSLALIGTISH